MSRKFFSLIRILVCFACVHNAAENSMNLFGQTLNRIGSRSGQSGVSRATFYDTVTGQTFIPKGFNYVLPQQFTSNFSASAIDSDLAAMAAVGTNLVRVIVYVDDDAGPCGGSCNGGRQSPTSPISGYTCGPFQNSACDSGGRLNSAYMDHFAYFLSRARAYGIYVTVANDIWLPTTYYAYWSARWPLDGGPGDTLDPQTFSQPTAVAFSDNRSYLNYSAIEAKKLYLSDFIAEINWRGEPLSTIFSFGLPSEILLQIDLHPFIDTSGLITTADGVQYNMGIGSDRHQAADANFVHWATQLASAVKGADPYAMVGVDVQGEWAGPGVAIPSTPRAQMTLPDVHSWNLYPRSIIMQLYASFIINYLDFHMYINPALYGTRTPYYMDDYLNSAHSEFYELDLSVMPVLAGEFGVGRDYVNPAYDTLVAHLNGLLCRGFAGGLLWTWNWTSQDDGVWKTGVEVEGGNTIGWYLNQYVNYGNPCS